MNKIIKAEDCKCCKCEKQAESFWPAIDLDIQSNPYCKDCLRKIQIKIIMDMKKEKG